MLIENKHSVFLDLARFTGQLQPQCLSAGQAGRIFPKGQIANTKLLENTPSLSHQLFVPAYFPAQNLRP